MYTILPICIHTSVCSQTKAKRIGSGSGSGIGSGSGSLQKISWNQQNDFHFNYLLIDLQFVTDQNAAHLHICVHCTYQSTFPGLMAWVFSAWAWQKNIQNCDCMCVAICVAVFAGAARIFNWKCYRIYEIVNMQYKHTPMPHAHKYARVDDIHLTYLHTISFWHFCAKTKM